MNTLITKAVGVLLTAIVILTSFTMSVHAADTAVQIEDVDVTCSNGAVAEAYTAEGCTAVIDPHFTLPEAWCSVRITVKNHSNADAVLTDVLIDGGASDDCIKAEYGISVKDKGEKLSPGEEYVFTVVLSLNTDKTELDGIETPYSVTLIYDAGNTAVNEKAPQTGDYTFYAVWIMAISLLLIIIIGKRNEKDQTVSNN